MRSIVQPPRIIRPELVEVGDKIRVQFPPVNGRAITYEGVVSDIRGAGPTRIFFTDEGASLVGTTSTRRCQITLLHRSLPEQEPLFDLPEQFADIRERIG